LKYLGKNLAKEVNDIHNENGKKLMKKIEQDTKKMERYSTIID
jgi:hypothetical protein